MLRPSTFRRATAAVFVAALGLSTVAAAEDDAPFASVEGIEATVVDGVLTVTGTPTFGGGAPVVVTEDGVDNSPGFDIVSATIHQVGEELVATMEISGAFAPGAEYLFPLGASGLGDNQLLAYANTTVDFVYQLANFDDGYSGTDISGSVDGSTITWNLPLATLGARPGARLSMGAEPLHTALGASAGGSSVNFGCCIEIDTADWTASPFTLGGGMTVTVTGGDVEETEAAKVRRGVASAVFDELPPGTYTVTVTTGFQDATWETTLEVTV